MKRFRDTEYFVSEDGNVLRNEKQLKPYVCEKGYHKVLIYTNGVSKRYRVHRLVGELYIPNPNNLPEIEHLDCIKSNNSVNNLKWVTHSENIKLATLNGLKAKKLNIKDVLWIRKNYIPRDKNYSGIALSKKFNVDKSEISKIIKRKIWTHI
jgi:hypothetical protein